VSQHLSRALVGILSAFVLAACSSGDDTGTVADASADAPLAADSGAGSDAGSRDATADGPTSTADGPTSSGDAGLSDSTTSQPDGSSSDSSSPVSEAGSPDGGTCSSPIPPDPLAAMRAACTFTTGALVKDTLGIDDATRAAIPIKHIVVMMKENRSFDHLLGRLHDTRPVVDAIPATFSNPGTDGGAVAPFHQTTTCIGHDPNHQWDAMHTQVNGGQMDGFVESAASSTSTDGRFAMSYYDGTDLPFYYWLANTYPLNDRHFASVRSGTFPNRNFLLLGTADGVQSTGSGYPDPSTPTIFGSLDAAGVTWGVYSDGSLLSGTLGWDTSHAGTGTFAQFLQKLDDGTLPQVAFVDGIDNVTDDHPTANLQDGETWSRTIYEHATASSLWPGLALLWTYDEAGGFFDHVPPPNQACIARPGNSKDTGFYELGVRIPMTVISPYARAGYVSHTAQEHTAITRFIETVFNLPALTSRDANSDALLDLFDFGCPPAFLQPPAPPAAGTGGCTGSVVLTVSAPDTKVGTPIVISFMGGPGNDPTDWIGVYAYGPGGPTQPMTGALMYQFIGGTQTASTSPTAGSVTIDATANDRATWPLPAGGYIAYYLLHNGYTSAGSIDFNVVP
jgi:phospholipase C